MLTLSTILKTYPIMMIICLLNVLYYDSILNDNVVTADSFKLSSLRNRIGIKGSIAKIEYNFLC